MLIIVYGSASRGNHSTLNHDWINKINIMKPILKYFALGNENILKFSTALYLQTNPTILT